MKNRPLWIAFSFLTLGWLSVALLGCASSTPNQDAQVDPVVAMNAMEAPLQYKGGSVIRGVVTVAKKDDRFLLSVNISGGMPGSRYTLAFFDNGNCSSPNAFSAGKVWSPTNAPEVNPATWLPALSVDAFGHASMVTKNLPNPERREVDVFKNRSFLIFDGAVTALKPSVKNNVVACGVFRTPTSLMDALF